MLIRSITWQWRLDCWPVTQRPTKVVYIATHAAVFHSKYVYTGQINTKIAIIAKHIKGQKKKTKKHFAQKQFPFIFWKLKIDDLKKKSVKCYWKSIWFHDRYIYRTIQRSLRWIQLLTRYIESVTCLYILKEIYSKMHIAENKTKRGTWWQLFSPPPLPLDGGFGWWENKR